MKKIHGFLLSLILILPAYGETFELRTSEIEELTTWYSSLGPMVDDILDKSAQSREGLGAIMGFHSYTDLLNDYDMTIDIPLYMDIDDNMTMTVFDLVYWLKGGLIESSLNIDGEVGFVSSGLIWMEPDEIASNLSALYDTGTMPEALTLREDFLYAGLIGPMWRLGLAIYQPAYFNSFNFFPYGGVAETQESLDYMIRAGVGRFDFRAMLNTESNDLNSWSAYWKPDLSEIVPGLEMTPEIFQLLEEDRINVGFQNLRYRVDSFTISLPLMWDDRGYAPYQMYPGLRFHLNDEEYLYMDMLFEPYRDDSLGVTTGYAMESQGLFNFRAFLSYNDSRVFPNYSQAMPFVLGVELSLGNLNETQMVQPERRNNSQAEDSQPDRQPNDEEENQIRVEKTPKDQKK